MEWYIALFSTGSSVILTTVLIVILLRGGIPKMTPTMSFKRTILWFAIPIDYAIGISPSIALLPVKLPDSPFLALAFILIFVSYPFGIWVAKVGYLRHLKIM